MSTRPVSPRNVHLREVNMPVQAEGFYKPAPKVAPKSKKEEKKDAKKDKKAKGGKAAKGAKGAKGKGAKGAAGGKGAKGKQAAEKSEVKKIAKVIDPREPWHQWWTIVVPLSVYLTLFIETFSMVFDSTQLTIMIISYALDILYLTHVVMRFFTGYIEKNGDINRYRKDIVMRYLKGPYVVDVLSLLPLNDVGGMLAGSNETIALIARLLAIRRLLRGYKILSFFDSKEEEYGSSTVMWRLIKYGMTCVLTTHILTCCWYGVACSGIHYPLANVTCTQNSWAVNSYFSIDGVDMTNTTVGNSYMVSLYWAIATATSTGYGDISAVNFNEMLVSIMAMLIGIAVFFGMLLGGLASILTNSGYYKAAFIHKFNTVKHFMIEQGVPEDTQNEVIGYYEYLWVRKHGNVSESVYETLPHAVQSDILYTAYRDMFSKVTMFENLEPSFLRLLAMYAKSVMYLPGQIIMPRGMVGHQMFYLHRGEVDLLAEDELTPIATLKTGKFFGEISLAYSIPLVATVRARTNCDILFIQKADLHQILKFYPKATNQIFSVAKERIHKAVKLLTVEPENKEIRHFKASQKRKFSYVGHADKYGVQRAFDTHSNRRMSAASVHHSNVAVPEYNRNATLKRVHVDDGVDVLGYTDATSTTVESTSFVKSMLEFTINPIGTFSQVWQYVIISITVFICFLYPYMAFFTAYVPRQGYFDMTGGWALVLFTYVLDLMLLMDIFLQLRTEIITPHGTLTSLRDIVKHHVFGATFWCDMLAVLPLEIACFAAAAGEPRSRLFALLRLNRVLKFSRVPKNFENVEEGLSVSTLKVRMVKYLLYIALISHWVACLLFMATCFGDDCEKGSWLPLLIHQRGTNTSTAGTEYMVSLYWAVTTMTSTGYGDISAHTLLGRIFSLAAMVTGLLIYGYCTAELAATLANLDNARVVYQEKLLAVKKFMKERHIGHNLTGRVATYMHALWEQYRGMWAPGDAESLMHDIPMSIQLDLAIEDAYKTLEKCPLFRDTDSLFLRSLAMNCTRYLFSVGEPIVYENEFGREMYFISKGVCQVMCTDDNSNSVTAELGPSQSFGEIGMLFGEHRSATVKAKTSVEVLELNIEKLNKVMEDFPMVQEQIQYAQKHDEYLANLITATKVKSHDQRNMLVKNTRGGMKQEAGAQKEWVIEKEEIPSVITFSKLLDNGLPNPEYTDPFEALNPVANIFASIFLLRRSFTPQGLVMANVNTFMTVMGLVLVFLVPLHFTFFFGRSFVVIWAFMYLCDLLAWTNIYLCFHRAYYNDNNVLVTHPIYTARNYSRTNLIVDLFASLPIELIAIAVNPNFDEESLHLLALLRINRCFMSYRGIFMFASAESSVVKEAGMLRSVKFALYTIVVLYWMSCLMVVLACPPSLTADLGEKITVDNYVCIAQNWMQNLKSANEWSGLDNLTSTDLFVASWYWASATAASVGYGDIKANLDHEMLLLLVLMISGVLFFGYVIASVAAAQANADYTRSCFQRKVRCLSRFCEEKNLPSELQSQVEDHYNLVWHKTKGIEPSTLFNSLPHSLWGDVAYHLYNDVLGNIPIFMEMDPIYMKVLCKLVKPLYFVRGEYLVRRDDIGTEMYFIYKGVVNVMSPDGYSTLASLKEGQAFGDEALLYKIRRSASIKAATNVEAYVLAKSDLEQFPEIKASIMTASDKQKQKEFQNKLTQKAQPSVKKDKPKIGAKAKDKGKETAIPFYKKAMAPTHYWGRRYSELACVISLLSMWLVMFQVAFNEFHIVLIALNYVTDVVYAGEVVLCFFRSYFNKAGNLVEDLTTLRRNYLCNVTGLGWDLVSLVPFELAAFAFPPNIRWIVYAWVRLLKLLRLRFIFQFFNSRERELDINVFAIRLSRNIGTLFLVIHTFSCIFFFMACPINVCNQNAWITFQRSDLVSGTSWDRYITAVYWCVASMTSTGYGDVHAYTLLEMVASTVVMVTGKILFGLILGDVSASLANSGAHRFAFERKLNAAMDSLDDQTIVSEYQNKVVEYFDHIWLCTGAEDVHAMIWDAPTCLTADLCLGATHDMLKSISLFEDAEDNFLRQISSKVKYVHFLPGDYIMRMGDIIGEASYLHSGEVDVLMDANGEMLVAEILTPGALLGEVSLLCRLAAQISIRVRTPCELYVLSKVNLDQVLIQHPMVKTSIDERGKSSFGDIILLSNKKITTYKLNSTHHLHQF